MSNPLLYINNRAIIISIYLYPSLSLSGVSRIKSIKTQFTYNVDVHIDQILILDWSDDENQMYLNVNQYKLKQDLKKGRA